MRFRLRVLAFGLLVSSVAAGQDDTAVTAAREIAQQGLGAYDAGDYRTAADKLWRAYQVVKRPTVALYTARALEKVGRLVEASEVYLQATRLDASGAFRSEQEQAQKDAARERVELMPRIPRLVVSVQGASAEEATVTVDGKEVPMALLGGGYVVDPGTRKIVGRCAGQSVSEQVVLAERDRKSVVLRFASTAGPAATAPAHESPSPPPASPPPAAPSRALAPPASPPPAATPTQTPSTGPAAADTTSDGSLHRTLGWVGLGVGGAGLAFGAVTGVLVGSKKSELDDGGCTDGRCYADQSDEVDSYNRMRTLSTVGFFVGVVGAAIGGTLLLTAPDSESTSAELDAWLGIGAAGVSGRF